MCTKSLCFLLVFCWSEICNAQQIVTTGGFDKKSDISINWIVGGDLTNIIHVFKSEDQVPADVNSSESESILKIYPIPAKDFVTVESQLADTGRVVIELYDNQGKKLKSNSFAYVPYLRMNISDIPSGIYMLRLYLPNNKLPFIRKIIKN